MMKPVYHKSCLLFSFLLIILFGGCTKDNEVNPNEIPFSELPPKASMFLQSLFSEQEPLLTEKVGAEGASHSFGTTITL